MDLVIMSAGQMTKTTSRLAPLSKLPHHTIGRMFCPLPMMQGATGPHTQRIFSGIGFRTWKLKLRSRKPYKYANTAPTPSADKLHRLL
ncbi:hypothetical protein AVEN_180679-1 [Araneus ventricosus]|uniref:Uncharacterized protein n=1 Tax=Araneus ventricosus TaxID=182803 RepID=A0A4Y2NHE7_ARAVE|nr:hypothetical protein AVEN_180679-1 [Araneus ventricosus]